MSTSNPPSRLPGEVPIRASIPSLKLGSGQKKTCQQVYTPASDLDGVVQAFVDKLAKDPGPPVYTLTPDAARAVLDKLQAEPIEMLPADIQSMTLPVGPDNSDVLIYIVKPAGMANEILPAVMYYHGGGWVLGNFKTHERLVREIASAGVGVVFVEYTPSPEAKYPVAIEQLYGATRYIAMNAASLALNADRLVLMGDSVGGYFVSVMTMLIKQIGEFSVACQILLYPVVDAAMGTKSYCTFADGPWLTAKAMAWYWQNYLPSDADKNDSTVSPLRATIDELKGLPPALLIVDENDVLRDEGEAYGNMLSKAGVYVERIRVLGTCHDFMMLNPLSTSPATRTAIAQVTGFLQRILM